MRTRAFTLLEAMLALAISGVVVASATVAVRPDGAVGATAGIVALTTAEPVLAPFEFTAETR
jgi:prepilin-type N-terminal cleavage/methylation domain-containing protein